MLKQLKVLSLFFLAAGLLASCNSNSSAAQQEAREGLENAGAVQPANPSAEAQAASQGEVPSGPITTMTFEETTFDFGTVKDGEKVSHTYKFKNTGDEPLILSNAKGSCGCTVPVWPREPIMPGKTGEVTVEFDSKNKAGKRNQKVTITANTNPPQTFINLNGEVIAAEGSKEPVLITQ